MKNTLSAGIFLCLILAGVTFLFVRQRPPQGLKRGTHAPAFAVPLVTSMRTGDANLAERGAKSACQVRGREVLNGCTLRKRGRVLIGFFVGESQSCLRYFTTLEKYQRREPAMQVVAVVSKANRLRIQRYAQKKRWSLPVGYDRDGALANRFRIVVCPQLVYINNHGQIGKNMFGKVPLKELLDNL